MLSTTPSHLSSSWPHFEGLGIVGLPWPKGIAPDVVVEYPPFAAALLSSSTEFSEPSPAPVLATLSPPLYSCWKFLRLFYKPATSEPNLPRIFHTWVLTSTMGYSDSRIEKLPHFSVERWVVYRWRRRCNSGNATGSPLKSPAYPDYGFIPRLICSRFWLVTLNIACSKIKFSIATCWPKEFYPKIKNIRLQGLEINHSYCGGNSPRNGCWLASFYAIESWIMARSESFMAVIWHFRTRELVAPLP